MEEAARRARDRDLSTPNPDYAIPTLHHAHSRQSMRDQSRQSRQQSRPCSRSHAGSIKDNIIDGIRDYIQPRPSVDHVSRSQSRRSSQAGSRSSSRPSSRGSMSSSKGWLRNAANELRRKGSWSSFRSNREENPGKRGRAPDKGPDLNRSLPPLPGLDQYKEPKKHIGQLLAQPKAQPQAVSSKIQQSNSQVPPESMHCDLASSTIDADQQPTPRPRPRIPFSDEYPKSVPYEAVHPRSEVLPPTEQRLREVEARRPVEGKQRRSHASNTVREQPQREKREGTRDEDFERRREQEIRRAVREKMMQGVLNKDEKHVQTDKLNSMLRENDRNINVTRVVEPSQTVGIRDLTWEKEQQRRRKSSGGKKSLAREMKRVEGEPQKHVSQAWARTRGGARESIWMQGEKQGDAVLKRTLKHRISRLWGGNPERTSMVVAN